MKTWDEIPEHIRRTYPPELAQAWQLFTEEEVRSLYMAFSDETGEFEGVGFSGVEGKFTRFANLEKYQALMVIEEQCRRELARKGGPRPVYYSYSTSSSQWGGTNNR
jgi:hypothetical protein